VAIAAVTQTLAALAEHAISHRDLKPDNLFRLDEVWSVGDFGLVTEARAFGRQRRGRAAR
jgi:serine/threonine protein kinase